MLLPSGTSPRTSRSFRAPRPSPLPVTLVAKGFSSTSPPPTRTPPANCETARQPAVPTATGARLPLPKPVNIHTTGVLIARRSNLGGSNFYSSRSKCLVGSERSHHLVRGVPRDTRKGTVLECLREVVPVGLTVAISRLVMVYNHSRRTTRQAPGSAFSDVTPPAAMSWESSLHSI